jgi:hypothetical protein
LSRHSASSASTLARVAPADLDRLSKARQSRMSMSPSGGEITSSAASS